MICNKSILFTLIIIVGILLLSGCSNSNVYRLESDIERLELQLEEKNILIDELLNEIRQLKDEKDDLDSKAEKTRDADVTEEVESKVYYGSYQWFDDFSEIINSNPIDQDYKVEFNEFQSGNNFTTLRWGALESKYTEYWEDEMNQAYNHLLKILDLKDRENLIASQKSWVDYVDNEFNFVWDRFIDTGYIGTQGRVQIHSVQHDKAKKKKY